MFAGCGGLDLGFHGGFRVFGRNFERLPFKIVSAYDNSEDCAETYRLNLGQEFSCLDLTQTSPDELPSADVLIGGFPCQDFSSSGPKVGLEGKRGRLYEVMRDYMAHHQPKIVVGENVGHLLRLSGGRNLSRILQDFEDAGYFFDVWNLYGPDFGLPQSRRRLFLVGVRNDLPGFPTQPDVTHSNRHVGIDVALEDLEDVIDESIPNQSQYFLSSRANAGGGQGDHANRRGEVAYCIRANARGRIQFHYLFERRLTVRECARLQSFPDSFVFPFTTQRNLSLIGNAVPPLMGHVVANSIADYLDRIRDANPDVGARPDRCAQLAFPQMGAV